MADNNDRLTEIFHANNPQDPRIWRAQGSDYSRRHEPPVGIADIIAMFFAGVLFTLLCAVALGSL